MTDRPFHTWRALHAAHAEWSEATFGADKGPLGPLKHLAKEAAEAAEGPGNPAEFADCLFLVFDAARRAGHGFDVLFDAACAKLEVLKARTYPEAVEGEPCEHVQPPAFALAPSPEAAGARDYFALDDYGDECLPYRPTPEGIAEWLAEPTVGWGRVPPVPALDGETFAAHGWRVTWHLATREEVGWHFRPRLPSDAQSIIPNDGPGLGWDSDMMCDVGDFATFEDSVEGNDEVHVVAIADHATGYVATFHADGPRVTIAPREG
ncbi:MAG: dATP/dGTP pyrophosphohydrolase domain-containing protein [Pseudomonadota bacterium]